MSQILIMLSDGQLIQAIRPQIRFFCAKIKAKKVQIEVGGSGILGIRVFFLPQLTSIPKTVIIT